MVFPQISAMKQLVPALLLILGTSNAYAQTPTYNDNVACILFTHCTTCHHDGGIAPFSLMTYADVETVAWGLPEAVNTGYMPPWPPNADYNSLAHERLLTLEEIDIINDWVDAGYPEGTGNPPQAPIYAATEVITNPDLVVEMPPFTNLVNTEDLYQCFVIPTGLAEDMFVSGFEIIPGNNEIVHHVLLFADTSDIPAQLDAADPNPGYTGFGGTGSESSKLIGGWVPGQQPFFFPDQMGAKLLAGSNIVLQVHYPAGTGGQADQTKVNFNLFEGTVFTREVFYASVLNHGVTLMDGPLILPPNQVTTFNNQFDIPAVDVTLLGVAPHMHLLGKSIRSWAVTPSNDTIRFFDIPNWDFHYQGLYQFRQPIKIPANSVLRGRATYDNTTDNPNNPNNPPDWVIIGEATTDEMFLIYFAYTVYFPGDENIVIDTTTVQSTFNDCNYSILSTEALSETNLSVYPNPVADQLMLNVSEMEIETIKLHDVHGRVVSTVDPHSRNINVSALPEGIYMLSITVDGGVSNRKIVVRH
ncbi:MAG: hypothetical protein ACI9P8_000980 [Bacteroidia bacterium]